MNNNNNSLALIIKYIYLKHKIKPLTSYPTCLDGGVVLILNQCMWSVMSILKILGQKHGLENCKPPQTKENLNGGGLIKIVK